MWPAQKIKDENEADDATKNVGSGADCLSRSWGVGGYMLRMDSELEPKLEYTITNLGSRIFGPWGNKSYIVDGFKVEGGRTSFTFEENISTYCDGERRLALKLQQQGNNLTIITMWNDTSAPMCESRYHITGEVRDLTPGSYTVHFVWRNKATEAVEGWEEPHYEPLTTRNVSVRG